MRPLKALALAVALGLVAAPAMAEARPKAPTAAKAGKHGKAGKKGPAKAGQREARILAAMKREGIDDARAKRVVGVMKKYRTEAAPAREEMQKHRASLRTLLRSDSKDDAAYTTAIDGIEAQKRKLDDIQTRRVKEIRSILTPTEQAKVLRLMHKGKKHRGQGAKNKSAKNASHAAA
jgi:Spy/CpxP family protein refolding chaperone